MAVDRVVVIGTSSGGLEALRAIVSMLPPGFATPVCIVQHIGPDAPGILHQILANAGSLPCFRVDEAMPLRGPGVYVARPDRHLLVADGMLRSTRGPRENRFRPAIDPLFRSAAQSHGRGVIGVVLTGNLDDGTSGLLAIKQQGGIAVVQDPLDARYPSMPRSAIRHVAVDHVVPVSALAPLLVELAAAPLPPTSSSGMSEHLAIEVQVSAGQEPKAAGVLRLGEPSLYSCPDCHGVLLEVKDDAVPRFRCHTGHAYSLESLVAATSGAEDDSVQSAIRAVDEHALLLDRLAEHVRQSAPERSAMVGRQREAARKRADLLRQAAETSQESEGGQSVLQAAPEKPDVSD